MDSKYRENVGIREFNYALTLMTTVIHINADRAITDAGIKSLSSDFGMPVVINPAGWEVSNLAEEHGFLKQKCSSRLLAGDRVEIVPSHGCTTINLHDVFHVIRNGKLEAIWPISGRGKSN
ncbi:3-hydroxy-D-aspartate aldolase [subsurface metagenome]